MDRGTIAILLGVTGCLLGIWVLFLTVGINFSVMVGATLSVPMYILLIQIYAKYQESKIKKKE